MLIFTLSQSQSTGLASHPLSATLLGWAWGRIWKKDELCIWTERRVIPLSTLLQSIRWARKAHAKPKSTNARWAVQSCAKRTSTNKATYLSQKSDFGQEFGPFLEASTCLGFSRERKVHVPESLKDFAVWRPAENRAWRGSCPESLRWVCKRLWGPRGGGDILTTCIYAIFHLSLLLVVKEASQQWKAKSYVGSSL